MILLVILFMHIIHLVVLMRYRETPVPIPNTEVKPILVDDTGALVLGK